MYGYLCKWKRLKEGKKLKTAAAELHLSPTHLSNIENGHRLASLELEISLTDYYQLPKKFAKEIFSDQRQLLSDGQRSLFDFDEAKLTDILAKSQKMLFSENAYLTLELLAYTYQHLLQPENNSGIVKFCLELVRENALIPLDLKKVALYLVICEAQSAGDYLQAQALIDEYLQMLSSDDDYDTLQLTMKKAEINWELGERSSLLRDLPEIRAQLQLVIDTEKHLLGRWNYLYGQCMLYYGFLEEAIFFLEQLANPRKVVAGENSRVMIGKILLFSHTNSQLVSEAELRQELKKNRHSSYFMLAIRPYLYTFASALILQDKPIEAEKVIEESLGNVYMGKNEPNYLYYQILKAHYFQENQRMVALSEEYFAKESFLAQNPFQAVDICKLMVEYYETAKHYKKASSWGNWAIKVSNTYFGCKSLV
ncbi:helix-turn-helix domain-containing protein [Enterococcus sp. LJL120]